MSDNGLQRQINRAFDEVLSKAQSGDATRAIERLSEIINEAPGKVLSEMQAERQDLSNHPLYGKYQAEAAKLRGQPIALTKLRMAYRKRGLPI